MKRRVVIITEIIAPYRIPLFNVLAEQSEVCLHVIFLAETDATQRQWLVYKDEIRFSYEVLPSFRRRIHGYNFLLNWGMSKALKKATPEAIVCGGYSYLATWRALIWAARRRVRFLLWSESNKRDLRSGNWIAEFLKKTFMRSCSGYVVAGSASREYLLSYGIPGEKIFTAPNAVDNDLFARGASAARARAEELRQSLDLPRRYFVYVGRLVREKGIFDLLEAYRSLGSEVQSRIGLVFVGDGPARLELERRLKGLSLDKVKIANFAQRDELTIYYGLAEALVFPTHSDPWGLVVNEAMACGLPILATNVAGAVADMVQDGENGFVTAVGDKFSLKDAMTAVIEPGVREQMAAASGKKIMSFSPDLWAREIVKAVTEDNRANET